MSVWSLCNVLTFSFSNYHLEKLQKCIIDLILYCMGLKSTIERKQISSNILLLDQLCQNRLVRIDVAKVKIKTALGMLTYMYEG